MVMVMSGASWKKVVVGFRNVVELTFRSSVRFFEQLSLIMYVPMSILSYRSWLCKRGCINCWTRRLLVEEFFLHARLSDLMAFR